MKRIATATAQQQGVMKDQKASKIKHVKSHLATPEAIKTAKIDKNPVSEADIELIQTIDARLQDLYYLADEEDFIGFC